MKSLPTSAHGVTRPNNFGACSFRVTHVLRGLEFMPVVSQLLCGLPSRFSCQCLRNAASLSCFRRRRSRYSCQKAPVTIPARSNHQIIPKALELVPTLYEASVTTAQLSVGFNQMVPRRYTVTTVLNQKAISTLTNKS